MVGGAAQADPGQAQKQQTAVNPIVPVVKMKFAKLKNQQNNLRARTVQKEVNLHKRALNDGRRNGFFNLNLNPVVERERSSKLAE
jgi:hypothetical protein